MSTSLLKSKKYQVPSHSTSGKQDIIIYNFPDDVKEKIARILSLDTKPDFTAILGGELEKGSKRVFNKDGTTYILFRWEEVQGKKIPRIIPYYENGQKKFKGTSKRNSWDTPDGVLLKNLRKSSGKL